jgi:hypothetical protein
MKTMKHIALAFALAALVVLWGVPVSAQTGILVEPTVEPLEEGGALSTFNGFEIATGHPEGADTYGWVCYGRTAGALPGNFTLTANYDTPPDGVTAGLAQAITGGAWTLPVYKQTITGTTYMGALYGTVTDGRFVWDDNGSSQTMTVQLQITGGTQTMDGWQGTAIFNATITRGATSRFPPPFGTPLMKGTLTFYFQ